MTMRIDAHQHFWALGRGDYDWLTPSLEPLYRDYAPENLKPLLDQHNIVGSVVVQAAETVAETLYLLELADAQHWILGVVGWCDFAAHNVAESIEELAKHEKLVGLRPMLQDMAGPDWILGHNQALGLAAMERFNLVLDALIRPHHLSRISIIADRHPDLTIVVDHAAKPDIDAPEAFSFWQHELTEIAKRPNVSCKFSGLVTEAALHAERDQFQPYVDTLFDAFGEDRLLWGSDWPVVNLRTDYNGWIALSEALLASRSDTARSAIYGENAYRIYRLAEGHTHSSEQGS